MGLVRKWETQGRGHKGEQERNGGRLVRCKRAEGEERGQMANGRHDVLIQHRRCEQKCEKFGALITPSIIGRQSGRQSTEAAAVVESRGPGRQVETGSRRSTAPTTPLERDAVGGEGKAARLAGGSVDRWPDARESPARVVRRQRAVFR